MENGAHESIHGIVCNAAGASAHAPATNGRDAEAARYALLRRLGPAIRHNMAGALQPIAMVASMLERRLQKPDMDRQVLNKNAGDIVSLSREAAAACVDLMSWIAPKDKQTIALGTGIAECVGMVATEFSFKGYTIVNKSKESPEAETRVSSSAIRNVFSAALLALTDAAPFPGTLLIRVEGCDGDGPCIVIELQDAQSAQMPAGSPPYRKLAWSDVEALAFEESMPLSCSATRVTLQCANITDNTSSEAFANTPA